MAAEEKKRERKAESKASEEEREKAWWKLGGGLVPLARGDGLQVGRAEAGEPNHGVTGSTLGGRPLMSVGGCGADE